MPLHPMRESWNESAMASFSVKSFQKLLDPALWDLIAISSPPIAMENHSFEPPERFIATHQITSNLHLSGIKPVPTGSEVRASLNRNSNQQLH